MIKGFCLFCALLVVGSLSVAAIQQQEQHNSGGTNVQTSAGAANVQQEQRNSGGVNVQQSSGSNSPNVAQSGDSNTVTLTSSTSEAPPSITGITLVHEVGDHAWMKASDGHEYEVVYTKKGWVPVKKKPVKKHKP